MCRTMRYSRGVREKINLKELENYSEWRAHGEHVQIISKNGDKILASVRIGVLIDCWIEKEREAYEAAKDNAE